MDKKTKKKWERYNYYKNIIELIKFDYDLSSVYDLNSDMLADLIEKILNSIF